jgi:hypothetical protein
LAWERCFLSLPYPSHIPPITLPSSLTCQFFFFLSASSFQEKFYLCIRRVTLKNRFMSTDLYIISGCNGAGKTTASYTVLPDKETCQIKKYMSFLKS